MSLPLIKFPKVKQKWEISIYKEEKEHCASAALTGDQLPLCLDCFASLAPPPPAAPPPAPSPHAAAPAARLNCTPLTNVPFLQYEPCSSHSWYLFKWRVGKLVIRLFKWQAGYQTIWGKLIIRPSEEMEINATEGSAGDNKCACFKLTAGNNDDFKCDIFVNLCLRQCNGFNGRSGYWFGGCGFSLTAGWGLKPTFDFSPLCVFKFWLFSIVCFQILTFLHCVFSNAHTTGWLKPTAGELL